MTPLLSTRNVRFPEFVPTRCLSGYGPFKHFRSTNQADDGPEAECLLTVGKLLNDFDDDLDRCSDSLWRCPSCLAKAVRVTALTGIGIIAILTVVLASAFSEALQKARDDLDDN